jgi:hypothetical protein
MGEASIKLFALQLTVVCLILFWVLITLGLWVGGTVSGDASLMDILALEVAFVRKLRVW